MKLFFHQSGSGGHEWKWGDEVKWEPTFPSGYNGSAYSSGIPLINDANAVYSGGVSGGHTSVAGEIDIVEVFSLNKGSTWYAKRIASGIVE
jgi:hypothetical protein